MPRYRGLTNDDTQKLDLIDNIMLHTEIEDGHLKWRGTFMRPGYPIFHWGRGNIHLKIPVRNFLFIREYDIKERIQVTNTCKEATCVLPAHQAQKRQDHVSRRRFKEVRQLRTDYIRQLFLNGYTLEELAEGFDMEMITIGRIVKPVR